MTHKIFAFGSGLIAFSLVSLLGGCATSTVNNRSVLPENWIDPSKLETLVTNNQLRIKGMDQNGKPAYECLCGPHVTLSDVPSHVVNALIATEDKRFLGHNGFDPLGTIRALGSNLLNRARGQGGSTITQQLCKNRVYSSKKSYTRKFNEIFECATRLETVMDKKEILSAYLNAVYFGEAGGNLGIYGIEQAARYFYKKSAKELGIYEGAVLVGMLKAPNLFNPVRHPKAARARALLVLNNMFEQGYLNKKGFAEAKKRTIIFGTKHYYVFDPRYFADWVLADINSKGIIVHAGARIPISIQVSTQSLAEQAFTNSMKGFDLSPNDLSGFVTMKKDGRVVAMSGGVSYSVRQYNPIWQSLRQPASAFKPIIYAAAIEKGLSPSSKIIDGPLDGERWPQKFLENHRGKIALIDALAFSRNIPAVRLYRFVGFEKTENMARRLGIVTKLRRDESLALGASEVTPLALTAAFAPFSNGGLRVTPFGFYGVVDASGDLAYWRQETLFPAIDPKVAEAVHTMLRAVVTRGTGKSADAVTGAVGKTGTNDNNRDAWFIGYTKGQITGVWAGVDKSGSSPLGLTGGDMARVWTKIVSAFR